MLKYRLSLAALAASLMCSGAAMAQAEPFVGEIMTTAGSFCPQGWTEANGQLLAVSTHTILFSLYGTTYGGDGVNSFAVPDLRGRMAMNHGHGPGLSNYALGEEVGTASVALQQSNLASHAHPFHASSAAGTSATPAGSTLGTYPVGTLVYGAATSSGPQLNANAVGNTGNNQPVPIQQPALGVLYCISLFGIYPSRP